MLCRATPATHSGSAAAGISKGSAKAFSTLCWGCAPTRSNISQTANSPSNIGARRFKMMSSSGAVSLGDIAGKVTMLEIECTKCDRYGRYRVDRLIERHSANLGLPYLREML